MKGAIKRIGALFYARNLEFVRDRAALVWNLAFPLLLVIGFSLIFSGPPKPLVQMGVVGDLPAAYAPLNAIPLLKLIPYDDEQKGRLKVRHHQLDLLLSPGSGHYWVNPDAAQEGAGRIPAAPGDFSATGERDSERSGDPLW